MENPLPAQSEIPTTTPVTPPTTPSQSPTVQPQKPSEVPPVIKPTDKSKSKLVPLLIFFLILALGAAGYFGWNYYQAQLAKEAVDVQPEPSPVVEVDETADWDIYSNTKYGYSLKYPDNFEVVESGMGSGNINTATAITVFDKTHEDPVFAPRVAITIFLNNQETLEERAQNHFNKTSSFTLTEEAIENWTQEYGFRPSNNQPASQPTKSLFQDLTAYEYTISGNQVDEGAGQYLTPIQNHQYIWTVNNDSLYLIYTSDVSVTNQILSTFKFVDEEVSQAVIPSSWTAKTSTVCNASLPLPNKEVDIDGRYWQYREGSNSLFQFTHLATVAHVSDTEASGYISGAVQVNCASNTDGYDSKQLLNQLNYFLAEGQNVIKVKTFNLTTMWNKEVYELTFEGGMFNQAQKYYLFTTPSNWYLVTKIAQSQTQAVQDTTNEIFNNLKF